MDNKYLIIRPKYGLCNQIYSISKGIIFGIISNRDIIFSFSLLNRHQIIELLMTKTNEGYKLVIPPYITNNKDYFRSRKSYINIFGYIIYD